MDRILKIPKRWDTNNAQCVTYWARRPMKSCVPRMAKMKKNIISTIETFAIAANNNNHRLLIMMSCKSCQCVKLISKNKRQPWDPRDVPNFTWTKSCWCIMWDDPIHTMLQPSARHWTVTPASDSTMLLNTIRMPAERVSIRRGLIARRALRPCATAALERRASSAITATEMTRMKKST